MRYTTARFGETTRLGGRFTAARAAGEVTIVLIDPITDALVPLLGDEWVELSSSMRGGFSIYVWPTSNIVTPPTTQTEFWYLMTDTVTGYFREGKFVLGGFPDESARARYGGQVHITSDGAPLETLVSAGPLSVTFASSGTDTMTRSGSWPAAFAIGRRVQISGTASNDGVTSPIVSITGGGTILNFALGAGLITAPFTSEPAATTTAVVKSAIYGDGEGTDDNAVDNIRDARQIAADLGFHEYHVHNAVSLTVDFPHDYWVWIGNDQDLDALDFVTGSSNEGARFEKLSITGALNGRIVSDNCILGSTSLTGVKGTFTSCAFKGDIVLGGDVIGDRCASRSATATTINNAGNYSFLMGSVQGVFLVTNMTGGLVGVNLLGSILQIHSSCTGGIITAIGIGEFIYTAGSGPTFADYVTRGSQVIATASATVAKGIIDITTSPWRENRYVLNPTSGGNDTGMAVLHRYDLYDQDGVALSGDHTAGNNPLKDPTRLIAERRRVV